MKTLTILLFLLTPSLLYGQQSIVNQPKFKKQTSPSDTLLNFVSTNDKISFVKIYSVDGIKSAEIKQRLINQLSSRSNVKLNGQNFTEQSIFGELIGYKNMDDAAFSKKTRENSSIFISGWTPLTQGLQGKVVVDVKDGKYRVTITEMWYASGGFKFSFDDYMHRKGFWNEAKNEKQFIQLVEGVQIISNIFDISNYKKDDF